MEFSFKIDIREKCSTNTDLNCPPYSRDNLIIITRDTPDSLHQTKICINDLHTQISLLYLIPVLKVPEYPNKPFWESFIGHRTSHHYKPRTILVMRFSENSLMLLLYRSSVHPFQFFRIRRNPNTLPLHAALGLQVEDL